MRILIRCPVCKLYLPHKKKKCKCGNVLKDKIYHIEYRFEGTRKRRKIGSDIKFAVIALGQVEKEIMEGKYGIERLRYNLPELLVWYLNLHEVRVMRRFKDTSRCLKIFVSRLPDKIDRGLVQAVLSDQVERGKNCKPATINKELAHLKSMLNTGVKYMVIRENPIAQIKLLPENNARNVNISDRDVLNLISHCSPKIQQIVFTAFKTLMRYEEIMSLQWSQVNFDRKYFCLAGSNTKNSESRNVPIHPEVLSMLRELPSRFKKGFVFKQVPKSTFNRLFIKACKKTCLEDFHVHDCRHYAANTMRLNGNSREQIKKWAGWKSDSMFTRYTFVSDEEIESIKWG